MSSDILQGIRPVNIPATQNQSELLRTGVGRDTTPAHQPVALDAAVRGRGVIREGMHGYEVQALYDELHAIDAQLANIGPKPTVRASIPPMNDPTSPFGGRTLRGLLRDHGMQAREVEHCASALGSVTAILPAMRKAIYAASGSSRVAVYNATRIAIKEILAELDKFEHDITASAKEQTLAAAYDVDTRQLIASRSQIESKLRAVPAHAIENYCLAVQLAEAQLDHERLKTTIMTAGRAAAAKAKATN